MKRKKEGEEGNGDIPDWSDDDMEEPANVEKRFEKSHFMSLSSAQNEGGDISDHFHQSRDCLSDVPDLTLIDLPNIAWAAREGEPEDIGHQIKNLIEKFIKKQETIILVVVPSNVDIATTEALKMAREVDPDGERTLGILTKPDLVKKGTEETVVDIVHNDVIHMKKGYMIVKCRGQKEITEKVSLTEATEREKAFFKDHAYFHTLYNDGNATVPKLAEKLTLELVHHIERSLPRLEEQIEEKIEQTRAKLERYGNKPPSDSAERLVFLTDKVTAFAQDAIRLTTGEELKCGDGLSVFSTLRTEFMKWNSHLNHSGEIFRKRIERKVEEYEEKYRGRELPSFIDYKTFEIASQHLDYQVPLVIRYQILQEFAVQLQRDMLLILQERMYSTSLFDEDYYTKKFLVELITMSTLNQQYEEKVRPCIDLIDSLRSLGVEKDLALPAIAVIGDQSSGKRSLLEALSRVALPRGSAQNEGGDISDHFISLEIASPDVPDLTLIDLPNIAWAAREGEPEDIGHQIKNLIEKFIKKQETIILVVVPSNVDIATTEALKMAREVDPDGERTLGILTKPDLVKKGTEETVVDIVHNDVIHMKKGYMIVKCRGQKEITEKVSLTEAIEREKAFFKDHAYFHTLYNDGNATVPKLAEKLTLELVHHIEKVTAFAQDAIRLTTGEELKCGDGLSVFSTLRTEFMKWNAHLNHSGEIFRKRIERKVEEYEEKYRGRELPSFIDYKTFEDTAKEQIKQLEELAVKRLKNIGDAVMTVFIQLAQSSFTGFPNLMENAMRKIKYIKQRNESTAESMLRTQFKMEMLVDSQDRIYSSSLSDRKREEKEKGIHGNHATLQELMLQVKSYYKIASQHLDYQVPLVIRYQILQEFAVQLQRDMLLILQESMYSTSLFDEDYYTKSERADLQSRLDNLIEARAYLVEF
ncbi:Interferon-induced GTP-binding protein Mx [Nibea albiflora]|uniref:Interferon-induced GTP-binding protein Mx n=1 Tax=Nibea albiflora TaxID=240163 RepID=A0ACB7EZG8_NIBAL|nr:Interferon-induced GTP-binding protein Mx [Nibea albiflora]